MTLLVVCAARRHLLQNVSTAIRGFQQNYFHIIVLTYIKQGTSAFKVKAFITQNVVSANSGSDLERFFFSGLVYPTPQLFT